MQLACQRHLDDLARSAEAAFPYRFDAVAARRVCAFIELLPHTKGKWARRRELIVLEPWQCFMVAVAFGWLRKVDGLRRYRRTYFEVPRKNAKSTTSAGAGNYAFSADGEHGAEVYSGATSLAQAMEVFRPAKAMVEKTPDLVDAAGIFVGAKNMAIASNGSRFEPVIGKPGDGASPSFAIVDEFHEHLDDTLYDTMLTGMGAREQPMLWVITTAGADIAGPCYSARKELVDVLEGTVQNDELFGIIFTIDEGDDWTSEEALRKANPNYGISVDGGFLRRQQLDAVNNPRKAAIFKTKHLNVWVTARDPYFNMELWNKLRHALKPTDFADRPCYVGIDLASKVDITASIRVFPREEDDGERHYYIFSRLYLPEARVQMPEARHYQAWVDTGQLTVTPGDIVDQGIIQEDLEDDDQEHGITELGYDPYGATQLALNMQAEGVEVVEVPQRVQHLSEPMKWVDALILAGRIHHDGNEAMSWMMSNVTAKVDANENVFPRKEGPEKKIDGPVALIIAMSRALSSEPRESVYEERGMLSV